MWELDEEKPLLLKTTLVTVSDLSLLDPISGYSHLQWVTARIFQFITNSHISWEPLVWQWICSSAEIFHQNKLASIFVPREQIRLRNCSTQNEYSPAWVFIPAGLFLPHFHTLITFLQKGNFFANKDDIAVYWHCLMPELKDLAMIERSKCTQWYMYYVECKKGQRKY